MTPVQIKICGITNNKDATACAELGVDMVGFNFYTEVRVMSNRTLPGELLRRCRRKFVQLPFSWTADPKRFAIPRIQPAFDACNYMGTRRRIYAPN